MDKAVFKTSFVPVVCSMGRTEGIANIPLSNRFLARLLKCPDMFQIWSIGLMKMPSQELKGFKLSPEAASGPNKEAWKMRADKMQSGVFWLSAAAALAVVAGVVFSVQQGNLKA
mmetsp:Transcript_16953/g.33937  ORF Transcript_16953/g.33937 Transcript_16953/m.33937 type:complete len:114 (+) Transcript_16953:3-344(+)